MTPTVCEHGYHDAAGLLRDPLWARCPVCGSWVRIYGPANDRRWSPHNTPAGWPSLGDAISGFYCPESDPDAESL